MATDERLKELRLRWQELQEQGRTVSAAELCAKFPELADELQRKIQTASLEPFLATETQDAKPEASPSHFGKFTVVRPLGRGGQATTLLVFDPELRRHVVLKLFHQARTPQQQEVVLREGQALARVRSPYVAQCYSAERQGGVPYLVVEYIPGEDLARQQLGRPLCPYRALELIQLLAEGLAAVHACGLLHRDLKPGNVLIGDDGQPRLVDFGLAAPLASAELANVSGTLAYMAPEQARGEVERIDARTDVFGLGAVLYYLLTGRPLYQGSGTRELWQAACAGKIIPPRQINPKIPVAVEAILLRCLATDPALRYASATEFAQAIRRWLQRRGRLPWLAGAAVASCLIVAGVALNLRSSVFPDEAPPAVVDTTSRDPDGKPLRRDFALNVELQNTHKDPDGNLYRIREGNLIGFRIESSTTCYVGIWYDNREGKITQLFPNDYDCNYLVVPGKPRLVPGESDYQIPARAARIPGRMRIVASTERWNPIAGRKAGPFVVFATEEELLALRNFDLANKTKQISELVFQVQVESR
jgi:serine/threonine protein kinase